jgi:hypothetical protein
MIPDVKTKIVDNLDPSDNTLKKNERATAGARDIKITCI